MYSSEHMNIDINLIYNDICDTKNQLIKVETEMPHVKFFILIVYYCFEKK